MTMRRMQVTSQLRTVVDELGGSVRGFVALGLAATALGGVEGLLLSLVVQAAASMSGGAIPAVRVLGLSAEHLSIAVLLTACFVLAIGRVALQVFVAWLPARVAARAQAKLQRDVMRAYLHASSDVQNQTREGRLQDIVTTQAAFIAYAVRFTSECVSTCFILLALVVAALVISPPMALLLSTGGVTLFLLVRPLGRRAGQLASERSAAGQALSEAVSETVRVAQELQVNDVIEPAAHRLEALVDRLRRPMFQTNFLGQLAPGAYQSVGILLVLLGLLVLHLAGIRSLASLGSIILLLTRCLAYGQQFQGAYHQMNDLWPHVTLGLEVRDVLRAACRQEGDRRLERVDEVRFDDVAFSYDDSRDVLSGVHLRIARGDAVAVVGPSGAGKSTLASLLMRIRQPTAGTVLVNGVPATEYALGDYLRRVAYVPQDGQLIAGSIAENIRFLRQGISDAAVREAAAAAGIAREIETELGGYDALIGQRLDAVSGGQRQRIVLARALATRPDVIVLDEPTSALDLASEDLVQRSLAALRGSVTVVLVAHRPSTIAICDRIVTVKDGRVRERSVEADDPIAESS
jgi:ABC-type multidrug transport system fused ATPase/permease subunit